MPVLGNATDITGIDLQVHTVPAARLPAWANKRANATKSC
jgi:hypothetical protein